MKTQHEMLVWAALALGWKHQLSYETEIGSTFMFDLGGGQRANIDMSTNPIFWRLASDRESRLMVALETAIGMQRICLNGGFDPRNPPRVTQEEQDVQDGTARHDEVQQDEGRGAAPSEGPA